MNLKEFQELYIQTFEKNIKNYLAQMLKVKQKVCDGSIKDHFISYCKEIAKLLDGSLLPDTYYENIWLLFKEYYELKQKAIRYDTFARSKNLSTLPRDFIKPMFENEANIKNVEKKLHDLLSNYSYITYYLNHIEEVTNEIVEYLVMFCRYDGSFGPERLKMLYKIIKTQKDAYEELKEFKKRS